jgi:hypothetical protein
MKKIIFSLVVMMTATLAFGQNSAIYKAEELLNENEIQKAQAAILPALTSDKTTHKAWAFNMAGNIESRILQKEIEKAAAKQKCDTTLFINSLNNAVKYFTESDKYDMAPNDKGKVKSEYHANNLKMVRQMVSYYAYAGQFENERGNKKGAYKAFEQYIQMPKNPVFTKAQTDSFYKKDAEIFNKIGYYASILAFESKDYDGVLKNVDFAIADSASRNDGYMMKLSSLLAKKDTANWVVASRAAAAAVDDNPVYCNNLLFYYTMKHLDNEAKVMADQLVQTAPKNKMAWYAHGCVNMNTFKKYADARQDFDKAIALDDNFVEAIYNKGVSFVNELISLHLTTDTKSKEYNKTLEQAKTYYKQAQPLFEKVRQLAPDRKDLWAENLRSIYFNLDMKDKAKEMETILNQK